MNTYRIQLRPSQFVKAETVTVKAATIATTPEGIRLHDKLGHLIAYFPFISSIELVKESKVS